MRLGRQSRLELLPGTGQAGCGSRWLQVLQRRQIVLVRHKTVLIGAPYVRAIRICNDPGRHVTGVIARSTGVIARSSATTGVMSRRPGTLEYNRGDNTSTGVIARLTGVIAYCRRGRAGRPDTIHAQPGSLHARPGSLHLHGAYVEYSHNVTTSLNTYITIIPLYTRLPGFSRRTKRRGRGCV